MTHAEPPSHGPLLLAPDIADRAPGEVLTLDVEETRHVRALRIVTGDVVRLTDGAGAMWVGRLGAVRADGAQCVLETRSTAAEPLPVELAFGVGNKSHLMWLIEKATEFGASRLQPIESRRTRSVADAGRSPAFWDKARRRAAAALKQSGGAWLPILERPVPVGEYLDGLARSGAAETGDGRWLLRLDPAGEALRAALDGWTLAGPLVLAVGPEGGWDADEVAQFDESGFQPASLGPLVLRFETAAIAGLAVVAQHVLERAR